MNDFNPDIMIQNFENETQSKIKITVENIVSFEVREDGTVELLKTADIANEKDEK